MATKSVVHVVTESTTQTGGLSTQRNGKVHMAYGRIEQGSYLGDDILVFDSIACREIVYAKFFEIGGGNSYEFYSNTDISTPFSLATFADGTGMDYVIYYVHGETLNVFSVSVPASK